MSTTCPSCSNVVARNQLLHCADCHGPCCLRCAELADGRPVGRKTLCPACAAEAAAAAEVLS